MNPIKSKQKVPVKKAAKVKAKTKAQLKKEEKEAKAKAKKEGASPPKRARKAKTITRCPHTEMKHYAKGMCNHCYHLFGRNSLAHAC